MYAGMPLLVLPTSSLPSASAAGAYIINSVNSPTSLTLQWLGNVESPYGAGDTVSSASVQTGATILAHGSDGDAGIFELISSLETPIAFFDGSLYGNTWSNCYSQGARVGYYNTSTDGCTYLRCSSEDFTQLVANPGNPSILIGGGLPGYIGRTYPGSGFTCIDVNDSLLKFGEIGADGTVYGAYIPAGNAINGANSPVNFSRTSSKFTSGLLLQYQSAGDYPFTANTWQFCHNIGLVLDQNFAVAGSGIFGFTDPGNQFGAGLFMVGNPTMNTRTHWKWKQTSVSLTTGANIVYLNGGSSDNGAVAFCDSGYGIAVDTPIATGTNPPFIRLGGASTTGNPITELKIGITSAGTFPSGSPTFYYEINGTVVASGVAITTSVNLTGAAAGISVNFVDGAYGADNVWTAPTLWGQAVPCMKCALEFDNITDMSNAGLCVVNGVTRISESPGFNYAASVYVGASCTATLVWEYDLFVPNYTSGNIG